MLELSKVLLNTSSKYTAVKMDNGISIEKNRFMMLCFLSLYFQHSDKHKKSKVIKKQERVSTKVSLNYGPRLFNYKVII